jgi:hypothetical protein
LQFAGGVAQSNDMLIPRFTLRWLFAVTTVVAVLALIASWAGRGMPWAIGVTAAMVALAAAMFMQVAIFGVVWLFAQVVSSRRSSASAAAREGESASP